VITKLRCILHVTWFSLKDPSTKVGCHFIRGNINRDISSPFVKSGDQLANMFSKGFMCDGVCTDLFPISVRIIRSLIYGVAASIFSTLGIRSLRVSYRLRGPSFRVYSRQGVTLN
jgi:hypothetical protein